MAEQFYTILTKTGKAKMANAGALGNKVNFTHLALGDGGGFYYNPTDSQQSLINEVWRSQIGNITVDEENPNWIVLETVVPSDQGGFMIREAGVFDDEGNLLAIGKYPETYKPVVADGSAKDLYVRMILEVSNTSVVTLKVDPSIILATKKDIDILSNKINDHWADDAKHFTTAEKNKLMSAVNSVAVGSTSDPNTTTEPYILSNHVNNPNGGGVYYHIQTLFYATKTGNRAQIALRYNGGTDEMYIRLYYGTTWTTWKRVWHDGNHGIGSQLDADMVDGKQANGVLMTNNKTNLVSAINELFTNVSNGKTLVGGAITDVDSSVVIPTDPTFQQLANAIGNISTGKKWASGILTISDNKYTYKIVGAAKEFNYAEITGLNFKPSLAIIYGAHVFGAPTYSTLPVTFHYKTTVGLMKSNTYGECNTIMTGSGGILTCISDYSSSYYNGGFSGGFRLPAGISPDSADSKQRYWIAIE